MRLPRTVNDLLIQVKGQDLSRKGGMVGLAPQPTVPVSIHAETLREGDGFQDGTRYAFTLYCEDGTPHEFLVDIPKNGQVPVDVWMVGSSIEVGDTPEDGFATFIPNYRA